MTQTAGTMVTTRNRVWVLLLVILHVTGNSKSQISLDISATPTTVDEGSSLSLSCNISIGNQASYSGYILFNTNVSTSECVVWFGNNCSTDSLDRCYCSFRNYAGLWVFRMNVQSVQVSDSQKWHCQLSSWDFGSVGSSRQLAVAVNGRPSKPTLSLSSTAVSEGGNTTLTCSSQATSMPESIRSSLEYAWTRGGLIVHGETRSNLNLLNVQREHEGTTYTCTARESGKRLSSEASNQVQVDVQYAPTFVTLIPSKSSYEVREAIGSVPNIRCQADCNPPCLLRWTDKGGNPVGGTGSGLQLTTLSRGQSGMFTCTAFNHLGLATASLNITVPYNDEASPPLEVSATSWPAAIAIGLAIGCVISGLLSGLVIFLILKRRRLTSGTSREDGGNVSYDGLDARTRSSVPHAQYQDIQLYEYPDFGQREQSYPGRQALDTSDRKNQTVEVAGPQGQVTATADDDDYLEVLP